MCFDHFGHDATVPKGEPKRIGGTLNEGDSALVVIGIDNDAEKVESVATLARDHTLQRNVGDWDDAEQDTLEAVKHEEKAATPA